MSMQDSLSEKTVTTNTLITYDAPLCAPLSKDYSINVNGKQVDVYECEIAAYAIWSFEGAVDIAITCPVEAVSSPIRPLSRAITAEWSGNTVSFSIDKPMKLSLEIPGSKPLHIFADPLELEKPDQDDPNVHYFASGKIYEVGEIILKSNETLYIEGGAIVRGRVEAVEANGVKIAGRGILDGKYDWKGWTRLMLFRGCMDVDISGIICVQTPSWTIVLHKCNNVHVHNIKEMGWRIGSDGIDVVSTHNVLIENCFIRANDDCVVLKCFPTNITSHDPWFKTPDSVNNVEVKNCVFWNDHAGNVMEIGYELRGDYLANIHFHDCDVIGAHGEGGVFTIHNGDRAVVENVLFENIRVEHFYSKLVEFTVILSRYSKDEERGRICNITLRNITTIADRYNTVSLIGGYDEAHTVENILFDNFVMGEKKILNHDDLNLYVKHCKNITFK